MSSIRDAVRKRMLQQKNCTNLLLGLMEDMLGKLDSDPWWKILICDTETLAIISAACRLRDVMQKNVTSMVFFI